VLPHLDGTRGAAGRGLGRARATVRKMIRKYGLEGEAGADED
jgi:hypothetical protein